MKNAKRLPLSLFSARSFGAASMRTTFLLLAVLLGLFAQPGIAEVYDPYTGPDPVAPALRLMAEPFAAAEAQGPVGVAIRSLNAQTFPFVFLDVDATDETGTCPLFNAGSFQVLENGVAQTDYFAVTPPNENQGVRLVDVVFIMDNSGSMGDDQLAVRNNVYGFVDKLTQAGINFAFGVTRYGQSTSSGAPLIQDNGNLTSDAAYFQRQPLDAQHHRRRDGAWVLVHGRVGDEVQLPPRISARLHHHHGREPQSGRRHARPSGSGAAKRRRHPLRGDRDEPVRVLPEPRGRPNQADPGSHDQLRSDLHRGHWSPRRYLPRQLQGPERDERRLGADRRGPGDLRADSGSDTTTYVPGSEPKIARNQETIELSATIQPAQTALTVTAQVTDQAEPFVQTGGVRLYYRPTSTNANAAYKSLAMTSIGTNAYSAAIPAAEVSEPGIDYYISATDGVSTSTDPTVDASARPYTIAVFPNYPPVLLHTVVTEAQVNTPILVCAQAYDTTKTLVGISLHYRKKGELSYQVMPMESATAGPCATGGSADSYQATIPQEKVTLNGVEYFTDAVDNFNTRTTSGSADQPHFIRVTTKFPPPEQFPEVHGIFIGSQSPGLLPLRTDETARDLRNTIVANIRNARMENMHLLCGKPSLGCIDFSLLEDVFNALESTLRENDVLIIYVGGHGSYAGLQGYEINLPISPFLPIEDYSAIPSDLADEANQLTLGDEHIYVQYSGTKATKGIYDDQFSKMISPAQLISIKIFLRLLSAVIYNYC